MTFMDHLYTLQNEDTAEGDVARDLLADRRAPKGDDYEVLRGYLEDRAPETVLDLLDNIHAKWKAK